MIDIENIPKRIPKEQYELSYEQKRLWYLSQYDQESPSFNIPYIARLKGRITVDDIQKMMNQLVKRHEILRTVFHERDGIPYQKVLDFYELPVQAEEIYPSNEDELKMRIREEINHPFVIYNKPLMRCRCFIESDHSIVLVVTMHHMITDGWSMGIFIKDLIYYYNLNFGYHKGELEELYIQYIDYSEWQRELYQDDYINPSMEYWRKQFNEMPAILNMPLDHPRPLLPSSKGAFIPFDIHDNTANKLTCLAKEQGATLFMVLLAAYNVFLFRHTMQQDIAIGSPVAGRNHTDVENIIGFFINTLVLRTPMKAKDTFIEYLPRVKETVLNAFEHQDLPFHLLVQNMNVERNLHIAPLFQTMFTFQNAPIPTIELPDLSVETITIDSNYAQYDISLTMWENGSGDLQGTFEYNTDLFDTYTMEQLCNHFKILLSEIADNPKELLTNLNILSAAEYYKTVFEWNQTETLINCEDTITERVLINARTQPLAIAIKHYDEFLTYGQLENRVNQYIHYLYDKGIRGGDNVIIYSENGIENVIAILAILALKAVYVPVSLDYPHSRVIYIAKDTGASFLICAGKDKIPSLNNSILQIELSIDQVYEHDSNHLFIDETSQEYACIIYTSGSTGEPKGALLKTSSIHNLIESFISSYNCASSDKMLAMTSVSSSSYVGEMFPVLYAGGELVIADKNDYLNFQNIMEIINKEGITIISTVASVISQLNHCDVTGGSLRLILSGGEALMPDDINNLIKKLKIVNGYGLTETTVCSTYFIIDNESKIEHFIPIGKPIINTKIYILDSFLNVLPVGCIGEIYIGGMGLFGGYINDSELTASKFVDSPFNNERLFKTGDLGCWTSDGEIRYVERTDNQVKIRGYRIDTHEIEAVLNKHKKIQSSCIFYKKHDEHSGKLIAYLVLEKMCELIYPEINRYVTENLPGHMIPASFLIVESIPYNINGKIDYKKLERMPNVNLNDTVTALQPKTDLEIKISDIWKIVLEVDKVGITDNFFDMGGHSLLLPKLQSIINQLNKKQITIIDLFQYPTIHSLAEFMTVQHLEDHSMNDVLNRAAMRRKVSIKGNSK